MRMSQKISTEGLLPIKLIKMADRSVQGVLPDGQVATWPADYSNKPTLRNKRVMLNCCYWAPVWIDLSTLASPDELSQQRLEAAQAAFERYDFSGSDIHDADGWDTSAALDYTRMTYSDAGRFNLHVRFEALTSTVTSVEAYDMRTGDLIGSLS